MIKRQKIYLLSIVAVALIATIFSGVHPVYAAFDPDGNVIIEDNPPVHTEKINYKTKAERQQEIALSIAGVVVLLATVGSLIYVKEKKQSRQKKNTPRKK